MASVYKITVTSRNGANGQPSSGYVRFVDGMDCRWFRVPGEDGYRLSKERLRGGQWEPYRFKASWQREKAIERALNALERGRLAL